MPLDNIGVLLFDDAELLDFAGPLQVFASFKHLYPEEMKHVRTIGLTKEISVSKLGMKITTGLTIQEALKETFDLILIPGGYGTRPLVKDGTTLALINQLIDRSVRTASVCTGSLVLAKLKKLSHLKATTHFAALKLLSSIDPTIDVDRSQRFYDHNTVIVSEGVSAGIDMSLYLLKKHYSPWQADEVRKYIEYFPEKR